MVQLQVLNKVLSSSDNSIIEINNLTEEYFIEYKDEFEFIQNHIREYGNVPDKATFLANFPDFEVLDVTESDRYLIDKIREEYLYYKSVPVVQKIAELLKTDANAAAEYMVSQISNLTPNYSSKSIDIVAQADERYRQFLERKEHQGEWFFTSGFPELDDIIHGIQRGEEFIVIFARVNQGKSWILGKMCTHVWQLGFNVGYISPEMSANSIGYRFDTLYKNFSNKGLMRGNDSIKDSEYEKYINELKQKDNKFIVATPIDFDKRITVSKLKNWVKEYKLDMIAVDGITYMTDERYKRGDNKTTSLTNISEDLMSMSMELGIPVLVVVQANRSGTFEQGQSGTPELESIRDSDGIAYNASKSISIRQTGAGLEIGIKKNRFGAVGGKLIYNWSIDTGEFEFIPSYDDAEPETVTRKKVEENRRKYNDVEDVF